MSKLARIAVVVAAFSAAPALTGEGHPHGGATSAAAAPESKQERCEHGVQKGIK
jgi:hypothetical protein